MASSKDYKDYILEQLNLLEDITYKAMFGEFMLYYKGIYFGGIFDNRFMVKNVSTNKKYGLTLDLPYPNAKEMYLVENIEDKDFLKALVLDTVRGLKWIKDILFQEDFWFSGHFLLG